MLAFHADNARNKSQTFIGQNLTTWKSASEMRYGGQIAKSNDMRNLATRSGF
jgi:hypothetical protein